MSAIYEEALLEELARDCQRRLPLGQSLGWDDYRLLEALEAFGVYWEEHSDTEGVEEENEALNLRVAELEDEVSQYEEQESLLSDYETALYDIQSVVNRTLR